MQFFSFLFVNSTWNIISRKYNPLLSYEFDSHSLSIMFRVQCRAKTLRHWKRNDNANLQGYIRWLKKTHQFWDACHFLPTHQIFMKICKIHPQSVFSSFYKNHVSNLSSFEDIIQTLLRGGDRSFWLKIAFSDFYIFENILSDNSDFLWKFYQNQPNSSRVTPIQSHVHISGES